MVVSMLVAVMDVGVMRVRMRGRVVAMTMDVWLPGRIGGRVLVPVMLIVHVGVFVLE